MASPENVWWIDERRRQSGSASFRRLVHYGPYPTKPVAEHKIAELKRTERYRKTDLVPSKTATPTSTGREHNPGTLDLVSRWQKMWCRGSTRIGKDYLGREG